MEDDDPAPVSLMAPESVDGELASETDVTFASRTVLSHLSRAGSIDDPMKCCKQEIMHYSNAFNTYQQLRTPHTLLGVKPQCTYSKRRRITVMKNNSSFTVLIILLSTDDEGRSIGKKSSGFDRPPYSFFVDWIRSSRSSEFSICYQHVSISACQRVSMPACQHASMPAPKREHRDMRDL